MKSQATDVANKSSVHLNKFNLFLRCAPNQSLILLVGFIYWRGLYMFDASINVLKTQLCHCVSNWKSYLKIYFIVPLVLIVTLGLLALATLSFSPLLSFFRNNFGFYIIGFYVLIIYFLKLYVLGIRFVCLDEKPKNILNLKYSKQAFLYSSYMMLIILYVIAFFFFILFLTSFFLPVSSSLMTPLTGQSEQISSALVNSLNNIGIHTQTNSETYLVIFDYLIFIFSYALISALLVFNSIAVATDIEIPFYRSVYKLKKFFSVNFQLQFIYISFNLLINYLSNLLLADSANIGKLVFSAILNIVNFYISIFFILCYARNFKLWHQSTK